VLTIQALTTKNQTNLKLP